MSTRCLSILGLVLGTVMVSVPSLAADTKYGPGVTDTEIELGQTMPYSGPASALGAQGHTDIAYFNMVNAAGGVNGCKIKLISLDDGYSSPKAVEHTRENLMKQALSIRYLELPLLLPGMRMNTSDTRRAPIDQFQIVRFDGRRWRAVSGLVGE